MAHAFFEDHLIWLQDLAINAWLTINPSPHWAGRQVEPYLGLPFGPYLRSGRSRRERSLTGPLDLSQKTLWHRMQVVSSLKPEQRDCDQHQSGIFSKLPYDIRLIIYEMVLGGYCFQIFAQNARSRLEYFVQHHEDTARNQDSWPRGPHGIDVKQSLAFIHQLDPTIIVKPLSLLLTCRKIYSEAVPVLYSTNTFAFSQNFAAFTFLKLMLPPQRLPCLRYFRLHMRIPRHPNLNCRAARDWRDLWTFFATEMGGLKHLHIELQMLQPTEAQIKATPDVDAEAEGWMKPIVAMATEARRQRGCIVEIETRRVRHQPAQMYLDLSAESPNANVDELLSLTCAALHRRVRLSLV